MRTETAHARIWNSHPNAFHSHDSFAFGASSASLHSLRLASVFGNIIIAHHSIPFTMPNLTCRARSCSSLALRTGSIASWHSKTVFLYVSLTLTYTSCSSSCASGPLLGLGRPFMGIKFSYSASRFQRREQWSW